MICQTLDIRRSEHSALHPVIQIFSIPPCSRHPGHPVDFIETSVNNRSQTPVVEALQLLESHVKTRILQIRQDRFGENETRDGIPKAIAPASLVNHLVRRLQEHFLDYIIDFHQSIKSLIAVKIYQECQLS